VQITARVDYAVRALIEIARQPDRPTTRDEIAERQQIPPRYLEAVLAQLAKGGLVTGHRGAAGGYTLTVPADELTVAAAARCVDGPLTLVASQRPERVVYTGASAGLEELWVGLRAAVRGVLEAVTIADLAAGRLPDNVRALVDGPGAWRPRVGPV
jgi:Rrf2 family protein